MYEDEISTWKNFADNLSKWKTTVKSFGLITSEIQISKQVIFKQFKDALKR